MCYNQIAFIIDGGNMEIIITGLGLGIGLAMDAFAVSMSNGLKENNMKIAKMLLIALTFAIFQGVMPLIGYFVGHAFIKYIEKFVPWIALILLLFLGVKMIIDGIKSIKEKKEEEQEIKKLSIKVLLVQAIATSIDALSTGVAFSNYQIIEAIICVLIIALVTFIICYLGVIIGKHFGTKLSNYADIFGGVILIIIGLEIFIKGMI